MPQTAYVGLVVILTALATCQITEVVRHGSIFETWRARFETHPFWGPALACGFCFSHHAGLLATILAGVALWAPWSWSRNVGFIPLLWLAAVRSANLLNDLTKRWSRTPQGSGDATPEFGLNEEQPYESDDPDGTTDT